MATQLTNKDLTGMSTFGTSGKLLFTSESVTEGHPDKVCDQISDSILDAIMAQDPLGRVACETAATTNLIALFGEITTAAQIDYESIARHGGGAFSGKDSTKVDRSAAYAARYVAKNVVAAGIADRFELQVSYAIGKAEPVSIMVESFGTGMISDEKIERLVRDIFDLRPAAIIHNLDLRRPIYRQTAAYGHFGRTDIDLPWERTDKVDDLRSGAGL